MARDSTLRLKLRAIDRMSSTIDRVQKKFPKLARAIRRASRTTKIFNAQTKIMRQNLQKIGGGLKRFGAAMTLGVTLPIVAAGVAGVKTFATFEQGLRGIEKTTGLTRGAVAKLGETFAQLSTEIPVSTEEMLTLAQAGGQLGIKGIKNIEKFTIVMAKLSRASDVAGEEGAKAIARILTVTGTGIDEVDRFASALVDLGNNAAASESEILGIATRIAGQIGRFDVASDSVLGIATALKSLGKNAESAGSVVGRSFDAIDQAIKGGGRSMEFLSRLTGIVSKDLKKAFETDATAVFQKFVVGLNKVGKGGGNQIKVLGELGLQGVRINDILLTLAKRPEILAENMDRATRAFAQNIALQKEFAIQTDSLGSEIKVFSNTFVDLLRLIGEDLAPVVRFFGKIIKGIFDFLRNNPTIRSLVITFGALAAVVGPLAFLFGTFLVILPALTAGMLALGIASLPITGTVLAIAAGIGVLIAVSVILIKKWDSIKTFFNENPFGKFVKFVFFVLTPLGRMVSLIRLLVASFESLDAVKGVARDILPDFIANSLFGKELGPAKGAKAANQGLGVGPLRQEPVSGQIGVTFINAPPGTNVKAQTSGPLDFDLGFAGALQ